MAPLLVLLLVSLLRPVELKVYETEDAIIIDAEPDGVRKTRDVGRQWPPALPIGPCFTSQGQLGRCSSFRQCYPYFKLPDLNNWDSWVLGMYDTCSYFNSNGRQAFGVCCVNPSFPGSGSGSGAGTTQRPIQPPRPTAPVVAPPAPAAPTPFPVLPPQPQPQNPQNPVPPNWPPTIPPLPTHPPDHTAATHPPFFGVQPTKPAAPVVPQNTTPRPTSPRPTLPPQQPPTAPVYPAQPPAIRPTQPPVTPAPTSGPVITDASCGAKMISAKDQDEDLRIVGGHNADLGEWPWIAALFNGGRQFCGGSLIDSTHILSAAHCIAHMTSWDVSRLTVRLGEYNIKSNTETKHVEKKVKRLVRHRGFDSRTLYNDIAILTLDSPVTFTSMIRPICLPTGSDAYDGKKATVVGWGSLRESGPQPSILQEVNIPIWTNTECRTKYGNAAPGGIVEHFICAGEAGRDSCSGDSGGPLMVNNGRWTQVGVVSWGIGCGKGQYPGVYTRVTSFLPWIQKNLN
ncbi:proclotting enzyme-like [Neocloeon triangulifer]|uniref:proclotting enzyme-like n=1 Tax=Neocloeon triangulifer TaxID=2078957 RepID=UPI00286F8638|nr:proclotting enzyme-like [Neocloeon triangulifer]